MTASKDYHGSSTRKSIMLTGNFSSKRTNFNTISRVSLLAAISSACDAVLPLWGFKAKRLPYRSRNLPVGA
eukprot:IDg1208t1